MRNSPTRAERILWTKIRNRQLGGFKFRRQSVFFGFIVDFYCPAQKLAIELDGPIHDSRKSYDAMWDQKIATAGVSILRFKNEQVYDDIDNVLTVILARLQHLAS